MPDETSVLRKRDSAFEAEECGETDLHHECYREKRPHLILDMAAATNNPDFASGPGFLWPTEYPRGSGTFDMTLRGLSDNRVWKKGYTGGSYSSTWTLVGGRDYSVAFQGTEALTTTEYIPAFGDVIDDLSTLTDGPGGLSGPGLISNKESPANSGKWLRTILAFDTGAVYSNYHNGTAWQGWKSPDNTANGTLLSAYASADSGDITNTPTTVPIDTQGYLKTGFSHSIASGVITINEDVTNLQIDYDVSTYLTVGVATSVKHILRKNGTEIAGSASFSDVTAVGVGRSSTASGSAVASISSGDTIDIASADTGALSTIRTVAEGCRIRFSRLS